ncbi:MAG: hypothetical protein K6G42_00840 [Lachnospiraceae bacterium]|nr:hypothetical protein [Lachnospiraceae bacterium]
MTDRSSKKRIFLLIAEIIILVFIVLLFVVSKLRGEAVRDTGITAADLTSKYTAYQNGWSFTPEIVQTTNHDEYVEVLEGPHVFLPQGSYTMTILYDCGESQTITLYGTDEYGEAKKDPFMEANTFPLYSYKNDISYDFATSGPIEDFEIKIGYNGQKNLNIRKITVVGNLNPLKRMLVICLFLFTLINLFVFKYETIHERRMEIAALIFIIVLASVPIMLPGIHKGHDMSYHLNRIDGIIEELRLRNIPVRIHSVWLKGMGYPVSIFRGDVLLYIAVFLRMAGFTVMEAYKAFIVSVNILTTLISYSAFILIFKDKRVAMLTTLAYVTATYRFIDIYTRAAVDEYMAMTFLPLVLASVCLIYSDESPDESPGTGRKPDIKKSTLLAVSMTGIIVSHTLSIEMVTALLIVFAIINIKKTIRPRVLFTVLFAVLETLLLTLSFIVPFVDYYLNVPMEVTNGFGSGILKIQDHGINLMQIFAFFQNPFGQTEGLFGSQKRFTPGALLIIGLMVAIALMIYGIKDKALKSAVIWSSVILLLTTNAFPWDYLSYHSQLANTLSAMEFPWRLLSPACAVLTALLGFLLLRLKELCPRYMREIELSVVALAILGSSVFYSQYMDNLNNVIYYDSPELVKHVNKGLDDFLRVSENNEVMSFVSSEGALYNVSGNIVSRKGNTIVFQCSTGDKPGSVTAPLYNYKGYRAYDDSGTSFDIYDDKYCRVCFDLPAHYSGRITIDFVEPWYWRVSEIISLIAWIALITIFIRMALKSRAEKAGQDKPGAAQTDL